jgi:predicted dehydrogenase
MNDRPRFGLIGTGVWPRLIQAPAARASDAVNFTSVFGRNALKAEAFAAPFGVRAYSDLGAFLDSVDIVGISVPPNVQAQFALAAAKAGKPVVMEKPLALDPAEADAIATELENRGVPALVFFTLQLVPRVRAWADAARASGGWIAGRVDSFSRVLTDTTSPFHDTVTAWRGAAGALWDTGPHAIALLLTILGEVVDIGAVRGHGDLKILTLTHAGGAVSTITLTMDAPAILPGETALFGAAGKNLLPPSADFDGEAMAAYAAALSALANGNIAGLPDARLGATVTRILAAAERSLASGRRIALS